MSSPRRLSILALALCGLAVQAPAALAKAPANDDRADAQVIASLPASITGTTTGSTLEKDNEPSSCASTGIGGSVWYRFTAAKAGRVVVDLRNKGDLDSVVQVFERQRSQAIPVECDVSDSKGRGGVDFRAKAGTEYLVRVARLQNSVDGQFSLDVFAPQPSASGPGRLLGANGVDGKVDRLQNPDDAYSVRLREGVTYRVSFSGRGDSCAPSVSLYKPGTTNFDDAEALFEDPCNSYYTYTPGPGQGGRYSFLVKSRDSVRSAQRFHLQVGRAGADDVTPGIFVRNYAKVRGSLQGSRLDNVDVYRFDVTKRSVVSLRLSTSADFRVRLTNDRGGVLGTGSEELHRGLRPGRYYAIVYATDNGSGTYTFRRISRTITRTRVTIDGKGRAESSPNSAFTIGLTTSPTVSGPGTVVIERYDAVQRDWNFVRRAHVRILGGKASLSYVPPAVGRYRATGSFDGSRGASPSKGGFASVLVAGPLVERR